MLELRLNTATYKTFGGQTFSDQKVLQLVYDGEIKAQVPYESTEEEWEKIQQEFNDAVEEYGEEAIFADARREFALAKVFMADFSLDMGAAAKSAGYRCSRTGGVKNEHTVPEESARRVHQ